MIIEKHLKKLIALIKKVFISFTTGSLKWKPGWKMVRNMDAKGDVNAILKKANKLEHNADTKKKVGELIKVYESALNTEPFNRTVLTDLARNWFLMAYGYGMDAEEKSRYYVKSIQYSERQKWLYLATTSIPPT